MSSNIFRLAEFSIGTASKLANYNIGKALGVGAALQTGIIHLQRTDPRVAKDTHKITTILVALNCIGTLWAAGKLAKTLQDKYQISLMSPKMLTNNWTVPDWSMSKIFLYNTVGVTAGAVTLLALAALTETASNRFKPENSLDDQTRISYKDPFSQGLAQTLYTTQIILNVALVCLGSNRIESLVTIGGLAGSLYSSFKMEWLNLNQDSTGHAGKIHYTTLLIPSSNDDSQRMTCSAGHATGRDALLQHIIEKFRDVVMHSNENDHYRRRERRNEHGRFLGYSYTLELARSQLPSCVTCEERPAHGYLDVGRGSIVWDGDVAGPKSDFGATLYAAYGVIQLTLVLAQQKYPHLAGSIYKIQKIMIGLDVLAIAGKIYDYQSMQNAEWGNEAIFGALAASALALGYILYYHGTETGKDLIDHFKGVVPEGDLANLTVNSTTPTSFRVMQWVLTNKILLDLALAPTAPNEQIHLISAAVEAFALYKLSQTNWIFFERKHTMPLMNRPFKLFDLGLSETTDAARESFENSLTEVTTRFHFIVTNEKLLLPDAESMQKTLQGIYDHSTKFFEDSFWQHYWHVTYHHGVEVSRRLIINAQILPRSLKIGDIDYSNLLTSWGGSAYKRWAGNASLNLQMQ